MLYLKNFYLAISDMKVRGMFFILFSISLIIYAGFFNSITRAIKTENVTLNPYLNVLLDNVSNIESIQRKLNNLPGVRAVVIQDIEKAKKEVSTIAKEVDVNILSELVGHNYQSLKVEISDQLVTRGYGLISEYIERLVGKDSVTISDLKNPSINLTHAKRTGVIAPWIEYIILSSLIIFWIFAAWTFSFSLKRRSYLIEKFQRRQKVAIKSFIIGMATLLGLPFILVLFKLDWQFSFIIACAMVLCGAVFNLKTGQFAK